MDHHAVEMTGIVKRFGRVTAVDGAALRVRAGSIHALVGENGAGKTTLASVLTGRLRPDAGSFRLRGVEARWRSPAEALRAGVALVSQEFALAPGLTVAENVMLGREPRRGLRFAAARAREATDRLAAEAGFRLPAGARVAGLPAGQRQQVEVLRALAGDPWLIVLDEPASLLSPPETARLFDFLRRLRDAGRTLLLVTHRLPDVLALADELTVMRRGRTASPRELAGCDERAIAGLMVGETAGAPAPAGGGGVRADRPAAGAAPLLALDRVSVPGRGSGHGLREVTLDLRAGEILGLAAMEGNGAERLLELLAGLCAHRGGEVRWRGERLEAFSPREARRRGVAYIPADRDGEGVFPELTVAENLRAGGLAAERAPELLARWRIAPADPAARLGALSGGNRQRVLLARELGRGAALIAAAKPERGLDAEGMSLAREALRDARDGGAAVVVWSAELAELLDLADRVAVLDRGQVAGTWARGETSEVQLGLAMAGSGSRP